MFCVLLTFKTQQQSTRHGFLFFFLLLISHRDLLDLSRVGDDLLHDLHGLTLGLGRLSLTLRRGGLDDLHLLALAHLHGHRRTLFGETKKKKMKKGGKNEMKTDIERPLTTKRLSSKCKPTPSSTAYIQT